MPCRVLYSELLDLIKSGKINGKIAKTVMDEMFDSMLKDEIKAPGEIVKEKGLEQIDNSEEIVQAIKDIIKASQSQIESYKNGNQKLFGYFVGEVMKATKGKANPARVNELLKEELGKI